MPHKIKLLSWNIWYDCHFSEVVRFLDGADADIIALQEIVVNDPARDTVTYLKNKGYAGVVMPHVEFTDNNGKHVKLNLGIFSKYPIIESSERPLREGKGKGAMEAKIQIGEKVLSVFSVHLKHTHQESLPLQNEQADTLATILPLEKGIVMGDFNSVPGSYPVTKMEEKYINTDVAGLPTWSVYPEGCPVCKPQKIDTKLDYIFVSPDLKWMSFEVGSSKGSDHLLVLVEGEI